MATMHSDPRLALATFLGKAAGRASHRLGRGSGASIRGKVLMTLDPGALTKLLAGRRIAVVTGTNGKTTTTHLLVAALRKAQPADAERVVTNADGANLHHGIASALAMAPHADTAVLETDERVVPDLIRMGEVDVLVCLNLSRDQMDRNFEITSLARGWQRALADAGSEGPVVVANANDPLVVWGVRRAPRVIWVDTGDVWTEDATLCPECGAVLQRDDTRRWSCPDCDLACPPADYRVEGDTVTLPDGNSVELELKVPGRFNRANAACALAAARELGVDVATASAGMSDVTSPAGRFSVVEFGDTKARLILAKNPAGWAESLTLATSDPIVLAINAAAADGRDVSWLWDVDFEQLRGRRVICTGPRAIDLAVRLEYGDVTHTVEPDLLRAITPLGGEVDVVSTYTPFQRLLELKGMR